MKILNLAFCKYDPPGIQAKNCRGGEEYGRFQAAKISKHFATTTTLDQFIATLMEPLGRICRKNKQSISENG